MKKAIALFVVLLALLAGCENTAPPEPTETVSATEAAEVFVPVNPIDIELDTAIEDYDLTGDGKPDSLLIRCQRAVEYENWLTFGYHWQFLVNGESAMEVKTDWPIRPEVALYPVSADRTYLAICQRLDTNDDMADYGLYQYVGGKLEKVCDFYCTDLDTTHVFHYGARLVSVAGDRIVLECSNQFNATAYLNWEKEFTHVGGVWQATGNVYPVVYAEYMEDKADGLTANQPITVHTATDSEEIAYAVPRGGVLQLDQVCIENAQVFFRVTDEAGRAGWLKDPEQVYANIDGEDLFGLFEEAVFAG